MTRVKVCGLTHADDIRLCVEEGVDALGFVVAYPHPVPWNLERHRAKELVHLVPPFVSRVAVVAGDVSTILGIAESTAPDVLQLHGDESEATVHTIAREVERTGIRLVKVLRFAGSTSACPDAEDWQASAGRFIEAGASAILFDSLSDDRPGGTGRTLDWAQVARVSRTAPYPVLLAGGLNCENVGRAIEHVRPFAVDVITGVEDGNHRKVRRLVRDFVAAARGSPLAERVDG